MWYIFPQIVGLGLSSVAKKYAIKSREEALAYTDHEVLGQRLVEITTALLEIEDKTVTEILGSPDDLKLKSCMTLFALVQPKNKLYNMVLDKFFGGQTCTRTAELLIYGR